MTRDPGQGGLADLLPDVQYGPPGAGRGYGAPAGPYGPQANDPQATGYIGGPYDPRAAQYGGAGAGRPARQAQTAAPARGQRLFVSAVMLAFAGISVLLPFAGTAIAMAILIALRAGNLTSSWAARRRASRGQRGGQAVSTAVYPLMLVWSAITSIALAPVALVAAGIAITITILAVPDHPFAQASAFAAGAIVLCYGLGPGSAAPRRQLGRMYATVARSPGTSAVILFVTCALSAAALAAAFSQLPFFWPFEHLKVRIDHWQPLRDLAHSVRGNLTQWYHRIFG